MCRRCSGRLFCVVEWRLKEIYGNGSDHEDRRGGKENEIEEEKREGIYGGGVTTKNVMLKHLRYTYFVRRRTFRLADV